MREDYEETIGSITGLRWERETNEMGDFLKNDTGNLIMFTKGAKPQGILATGYISFIRENKREWCISIREILLRKFAPKKEDEVFQEAMRENSSLVIPLPIMLADNDKLIIYRPEEKKVRGITFCVEMTKKE